MNSNTALSVPSSPPTSMTWTKSNNDEQTAVMETELREWFKKCGALSQIKAQLRVKLIRELLCSTGMSIKNVVESCQRDVGGSYGSTQPFSLKEQLLHWVVVHHMKTFGLVQSLSVFLPESGLPEHHIPKPEDIMEGLGLFPQPSTASDTVHENYCLGSGVSNSMLSAVVDMARNKVLTGSSNHTDKEVQTDTDSLGEWLHRKLSCAEEKWHLKSCEATSVSNTSAIMIAHQRECEIRANSWAKEDLEMFKTRELIAVQEAGAAKYRNELEMVRREAAAECADRIRRMYEDEIALKRKFQEKETYYEDVIRNTKEEMQEELTAARLKEEQIRQELNRLQSTAKNEAQKVRNEAVAIEERSKKLDQREAELHRKSEILEEKAHQEARRSIRLEAEAVERDRDFISSEAKSLMQERKLCQERLMETKRCESECHKLRRSLEIEKKKCSGLQNELIHARQEIDTYREAYETGRPIEGYPNYPLPDEAERARRLRRAEKGMRDLLLAKVNLESVAKQYKDERDEAESRLVIEVASKEALMAEAAELRRLLSRARTVLRSIADPGLGNLESTENTMLSQSNPAPCISDDVLRKKFVEEWREIENAGLFTSQEVDEKEEDAIHNVRL